MAVNMVLVRTLVEQSVEGVEILQAENGMQVLELLRRQPARSGANGRTDAATGWFTGHPWYT